MNPLNVLHTYIYGFGGRWSMLFEGNLWPVLPKYNALLGGGVSLNSEL